ncbi:MAG: T9SS type A sorting domain-containing protein [Gelidibacter sp.]
MKNIYLKNLQLVLCFVGFFNLAWGQSDLFEVPLREQINTSTQIVEGKVISKRSMWDSEHHNIYTVNTIEIYKVFKGSPLSTLEIITEGGVVDMKAQITTSSLDLAIDDIGVFMLYDNNINFSSQNSNPSNKFRPYSAIQGFYKYNIYENKASNPFKFYNGISQVFYNEIKSLTQKNFVSVLPFDIDNQRLSENRIAGSMAITSFSPQSISGGTRSVLTIDGAGFGSATGNVSFRDANDGGSSLYNALPSQIISWTDTQIQVQVPSRAGTGTIRVSNSIGVNVTSTSALTIPYSEINVISSSNVAYPTQHINDNGSGGYTWAMYLTFAVNAAATQSFTRAFDSWRCETGVNWEIDSNFTTVNTIAADGTNVIRFDVGTELPNGVLGRNTSYFNGCSNGSDLEWYVSELDIVFDSSANWQYGPSNPNAAQIDFETVAVHELGHGHQLAHVINTNAIMHYAIGNGVNNRILAANDIAGGNDVQSRSTTNAVCGLGLMTNHSCSLGIDENELASSLLIYPNPAKNQINIKNNYQLLIQDIELVDVTGRSIQKQKYPDTLNIYTLDSSNLSSGLYMLNINVEGITLTKKVVIE